MLQVIVMITEETPIDIFDVMVYNNSNIRCFAA